MLATRDGARSACLWEISAILCPLALYGEFVKGILKSFSWSLKAGVQWEM